MVYRMIADLNDEFEDKLLKKVKIWLIMSYV